MTRRHKEVWSGANHLGYEVDVVAQVLVTSKRGMTLEEIGTCLGCTRENVRQAEVKALIELRLGLLDEGWHEDDIKSLFAEWQNRVQE